MAEPSKSLEPDFSDQVLDRYHLLHQLGIGGMGAVYEAEHTALEKRVAVKMLRHEFTMQDIARKRFLREAKAATRVKHPNVVDISDFGETPDGRVYFVMELLDGRDLGELLKKERRLPWPRAKKILLQVVSALEAAHTQGIIHRDMKPSNCFLVDMPGLGDVDFIKVLDFGIAKFAGGGGNKEETEGLTSTDEVFGTVAYMSPEMAQGTTNDLRSDIYAMGVMMYRMLTGELPFSEGNAFQILSQHIGVAPPSPRSKEPSIPEGVEQIILKALQKDVRYRFQSMRELAEAIEHDEVPLGHAATMALSGGVLGGEHTRPLMGSIDAGAAEGEAGSSATEVLDPMVPALADSSGPSQPMPVSNTGATMLAGGPVSPTGPTVSIGAASSTTGPAAASGSGSVASLEHMVTSGTLNATQLAALAAGVRPKSGTLPVALLIVLVAGVFVGAVALGVYIARGQGSEAADGAVAAEAVEAAAGSPAVGAEPEASTPDVASPPGLADPLVATPAALVAPESSPAPVPTPAVEPEPEEPPAAEPVPPAKPKPKPRVKKARSDSEVIAGLRRKMKSRCSVDGATKVRLEGMISAEGKVQGAMATPRAGPGGCAEKILRASRFARRPSPKIMPMFTVSL